MTSLLFFLGCIVLFPIAVLIVTNFICPLIWKLKYIILPIVLLPIIAAMWLANQQHMQSREEYWKQPKEQPEAYRDSTQKWIAEHKAELEAWRESTK